MATNLSGDPDSIDAALEASGRRTKRTPVTEGLGKSLARGRQKDLLALFGKHEWEEGYRYKADRTRD